MERGLEGIALGFWSRIDKVVSDILTIGVVVNGGHYTERRCNCCTENHFLWGADLPFRSIGES